MNGLMNEQLENLEGDIASTSVKCPTKMGDWIIGVISVI